MFPQRIIIGKYHTVEYNTWKEYGEMPHPVCNQVAAYDTTSKDIKIFGGSKHPMAAYTFNGSSIIYHNTSRLNNGIIAPDSSWTSFGNLIYYINQNGTTLNIRSLNIQTLNDEIIWTQTVNEGTDFGICVDDTPSGTGNVYIVGYGKTFTCQVGQTSCTQTNETNAVDSIIDTACAFYDGNLYLFGGRIDGDRLLDTIWKCDPEIDQSCSALTDTDQCM